jgi:hypothetical protein
MEKTSREKIEARGVDGKFVLSDLVEASVVFAFILQALGKATNDAVREKIAELGGEIDEHLIGEVAEALQGRGIISYSRGRLKGTGESVRAWKMRRAIWGAPPEMAQLVELLPRLVATDEAEELIGIFNKGEEEGEGEKKSQRKLGYDEYVEVRAHFVTIDELLGSQPKSPYLDSLVKRFPHGGVEADLRFWRESNDGALIIGSDAVCGWLRTGMRTAGFPEAASQYIAADLKFQPAKPLVQIALPVIDMRGGGGKGITSYEGVVPGQELTIKLRIPARGIMTPNAFALWLASYAPRPIRGISPARGKRFGRLAMTGFTVLGEMASAKTSIESVMEGLPEAAREFYQRAAGALAHEDVRLRKGKV